MITGSDAGADGRTNDGHQLLRVWTGLVAFYDIRPGNGAGLFSKEKISKSVDK